MFKWNQIKFTKRKLKWNTFYDIILRESGNQFSQTKLLFGFNITMKLISFFFSFWNKYWLSLWHCTFCSPKSAMMQLFQELQKLDLSSVICTKRCFLRYQGWSTVFICVSNYMSLQTRLTQKQNFASKLEDDEI